jgi:hypothetical protein
VEGIEMKESTQRPSFLDLLAKPLGVQNQANFKELVKKRGGRRSGAGRKPKSHGGWRPGAGRKPKLLTIDIRNAAARILEDIDQQKPLSERWIALVNSEDPRVRLAVLVALLKLESAEPKWKGATPFFGRDAIKVVFGRPQPG